MNLESKWSAVEVSD